MADGKRDLHGFVQNNPILNLLLDQGNKLRYGVSEADRMDMVNTLSAPGVKDYAYDARGIYDPAAAERYTSAYLGGQNWAPNAMARDAFHAFSGSSRAAMNKMGVPGVGEERPELTMAEQAGMKLGASIPPMMPSANKNTEVRPSYGLEGASISPGKPESIMEMLKRILSSRGR